MTTRILKLEDEDVELLGKLVRNIHRRLENNPSDPAVSEHLMSAHRLFTQFEEGLPTELQFVRSIKDADLEKDMATAEKRAKKRATSKSRLAAQGIRAKSETMEAAEPLPEPKKRKVRTPKGPPKPKEILPCSEHNNSGARAPRGDCKGCWGYYRHLHPDRYTEAWKKHKAKRQVE